MSEEITAPKWILEESLGLLNKLDYNEQGDDGDTTTLFGEFSLDWFYYIKNHLEKVLNND